MRNILRWVKYVIVTFFVSTVLSVLVFKWMPVYFTPLMFIRLAEQAANGDELTLQHEWVPMSEMSNSLPWAVMASEDTRFMKHHGFDFREIYKARLEALDGGRERGASTISQQTAKNVFLWPGHSWVRKGLEAYFTVLIEAIWGKERIMEVYLNSVEMGNGIYGAKAIAAHSFGCQPAQLTMNQAALIAATLPDPRHRDSANPTGKLLERRSRIRTEMRALKNPHWGVDN